MKNNENNDGNKKYLISIIIPFFGKSYKYQLACLQEINNLKKLQEVQIIISTNEAFRTNKLLNQINNSDKNILITINNGATRLKLIAFSLKHINSKYSLILDMDDQIYLKNFKRFLETIKKNNENVDLILNFFYLVREENLSIRYKWRNNVLNQPIPVTPNAIIKSKLLKANEANLQQFHSGFIDDTYLYFSSLIHSKNPNYKRYFFPFYKYNKDCYFPFHKYNFKKFLKKKTNKESESDIHHSTAKWLFTEYRTKEIFDALKDWYDLKMIYNQKIINSKWLNKIYHHTINRSKHLLIKSYIFQNKTYNDFLINKQQINFDLEELFILKTKNFNWIEQKTKLLNYKTKSIKKNNQQDKIIVINDSLPSFQLRNENGKKLFNWYKNSKNLTFYEYCLNGYFESNDDLFRYPYQENITYLNNVKYITINPLSNDFRQTIFELNRKLINIKNTKIYFIVKNLSELKFLVNKTIIENNQCFITNPKTFETTIFEQSNFYNQNVYQQNKTFIDKRLSSVNLFQ